MKRIGRILALLFCLSLSACSLMPEEEVYRSAPVTKDYEAAPYQFAAVVRGDMDFAVIRYQEPYFGFFLNLMEEWNLDYEPLFSFQQLALVSRSHPLAGRAQICAQDLMPYIEVVHGDYQVPALTLAEFPTSLPPTASHNQKIYVYDRGSQFEVLRQVSGSYMWVSPIPQETLDEYQMLTLPCQDFDTTSCDAIIYPRNKKLSDWSKRCIEFMKDYVKSLR